MGLINGKVCLENNYELWKKMYEEEKDILINIFKDENFIYEHVGSTSIKGLAAKPIVDIAIGVSNLDQIDKYVDTLKSMYTVKYNNDSDEILLIKENDVETFFLIHILEKNSKRYLNLIKFRDILNKNPDIVKEYENLKLGLLKKYADNRKLYTQSKNDFIQDVLNNM
jgi:GrpB-like predicted nucleotidyltransferase (UPF0157 family)